MRGNNNRFDSLGHSQLVLDGDLSLAVGPKKGEGAVLARLRKLLCEPVGERDRERHELRRFATRKADHHALVPRALQLERVVFLRPLPLFERVVDAGGDIG